MRAADNADNDDVSADGEDAGAAVAAAAGCRIHDTQNGKESSHSHTYH